MGETSRERFLQQLERCVKHQNQDIPPENPICAPWEPYVPMGEYLAPEDMGNGETDVETDAGSPWGLRPPGDPGEPPILHVGDWA